MSVAPPTELLAAARAGDPAAREQLVATHLDTVRAVCASRLASPHDVADAVQETFLRALPRLGQVRDADAVAAWLRAIAVRVCADHGRAADRTVCVADAGVDEVAPGATPHELAVAADEARRLRDHLADLSDRDRRALWLRDAIGLPVTDVAEDLGVTEGSARVLLHRARTRLRAAYQGLGGLVLGGVARLRQRLAALGDTVPVDLHAAVAAQVAMAIAMTLMPSVATPTAVPAAPAGAAGTGSVATSQPAGAVASPRATGAPGTTTAVGSGRDPSAAASGPMGSAPTGADGLVVTGNDEPDAPRGVEVSASDSDGEVAELIVYGGSLLGGDDGDGDADGRDGDSDGESGDAEDDHGDGDGHRTQVGPVVVTHPDLSTVAPVIDSRWARDSR